MFKGLIKKLFPHLMSHIEEVEYERKTEEDYNSMLTSELDEIVKEYDNRSTRGRFFAPQKDIINYRVAQRIIGRRKEGK